MLVRFQPRGHDERSEECLESRRLRAYVVESNAGAMPSQQARPRGGAQPEGAGSDREVRAIPTEGTRKRILFALDSYILGNMNKLIQYHG